MHKGLPVFIALLIVGLMGCDLGTDPEDANGENGEVTFSEDVEPMLANNCAFSGCHGTSNTQQDLVLAEGEAYNNLVDVPSREMPELDRVEPGEPDSSFLLLKLKPNPPAGGRMPQGGPYFSDEQIETVETWISEGAEDN